MRTLELSGKRIFVAGHRGMVGSAILRRLSPERCSTITVPRSELDLRRQSDVEAWMVRAQPEIIILAAATVGGIVANSSRPADFLYDNLAIQTNVLEAARTTGVQKLLFLGSSCIYPKFTPQPIKEDALLTAPLEPTNEWYAIAKIAGIKLCQAYKKQHGCNFISLMPTNLYGPNDNFDLTTSHVLPALIAKVHRAKVLGQECVEIWGTGEPRREFLHVDDLADACILALKRYDGDEHVNVGTGMDVTIRELAEIICRVIGYAGRLHFDPSRPDGTPRKLLDISRLSALGWKAHTGLEEGIQSTYDWYLDNQHNLRGAA